MRRVTVPLITLCALVLVVTLCGCGGSGAVSGPNADSAAKPPAPQPTLDKMAFHNIGARADSTRNEIFTMYTNGTGATQLTAGAAQGSNSDPAWSPTGTQICFTSTRDGYSRLYLMGADGSGQSCFTPIQDAHDGLADWSPTGDRIAFCRGPNLPSYLWVREVDSGTEMQLAHVSGLVDYAPCWDPSGALVVLRRYDPAGGNPASGLYVVQADGSPTQTLILQGDGYECPSWSPLGDRIAYSSGGDIWTIVVDPATGVPVQPEQRANLTNTSGATNREPTWSPDGLWIAYQSMVQTKKGATFSVRKIPAAAGSVTSLGTGFAPDWSPVLP